MSQNDDTDRVPDMSKTGDSGVAAEELCEADFGAALKAALRHFQQPDALRENPLLTTRLVASRASGAGATPTQALCSEIEWQTRELAATPKLAQLARALELTYLAPLESQQRVAEAMHLSWSTYRRRLASAVKLLSARMWESEQALRATPADQTPTAAPSSATQANPAAYHHGPRSGWGRAIVGLIACAVVAAVVWFLLPWDATRIDAAPRVSQHQLVGAPGKPGIAVLPFDNLSADPENVYFATGIRDEILTRLAKTGGMKVIARTSADRYPARPTDLRAIGNQLGISHVLEGSVQKSGDEVLVNVQLINVHTLAQEWAHSYPRRLQDVFGVEGEVASHVASALNATLSPVAKRRLATPLTRNADAYTAFLRGQYYLKRALAGFLKTDFDAAIKQYREAVRLDPSFAMAWARMSLALSSQSVSNDGLANVDPAALGRAAGEAAAKALTIAPDLAAAHTANGWYRLYERRDPRAAAAAFGKALELQPDDPDALFGLGSLLESRGKPRRARTYLRRAVELDPENAHYLVELVSVLNAARDYAAAEAPARQARAIHPDSLAAVVSLSNVYVYSGRFKRAMAALDAAPKPVHNNPYWQTKKLDLLILQGQLDAAKSLADAMKPGGLVEPYLVANYRANVAWYAEKKAQARNGFEQVVKDIEARYTANPKGVLASTNLGWALARLGKTARALAIVKKQLARRANDENIYKLMAAIGNAAYVAAAAGNHAMAIKLLKRLRQMPYGDLISSAVIASDPAWGSLHDDPAFKSLVRQLAASEKPVPPQTSVVPEPSSSTAAPPAASSAAHD